MSDFDLSAYLAEQQAAGTAVGEGDFTVSHEKAALKMSRYSLPRDFSWVLKLVQAAVGANCSAISVTQTRNSSFIVFESERPRELPSIQELVRSVLQISLESEQVADRIGSALRLLVERSHGSFLLRVDRGDGEPQAMYAGVHFSEIGEAARTKIKESWSHPLSLRINHVPHSDPNRQLYNLIPLRDQALPMALELERYAYVSSIPITLDGRRLDGILRTGALKWSPRKKPIRLSGIPILDSGGTPLAICEGFVDRVFAVDEGEESTLSDSSERGSCQAYILLSLETCRYRYEILERRPRSRVCWVKDGVIVEEEVLNVSTQALGLQIYLSADGIGTDLTGFHLVRGFYYFERRGRVLERVRELLASELDAGRTLFSQPAEDLEPIPDHSFKGKLEAFRKSIEAVRDALKDQTVYWDRAAVARAYKNDLQELFKEVGQMLEGPKEVATEQQSGDRGAPDQVKEELPNFYLKETFKWVPPEER